MLALPDRHFYWRARSNAMTIAFSHRAELSDRFDLVIATSMVDLCTLRGFAPHLAFVPTLLYFHENQFDYPVNQAGGSSSGNIINAQLTSIYAALCAERILFNSEYNRATFFDGAKNLLKRMPDGVPADLLKKAELCSSVLPVPIHTDETLGNGAVNDKVSGKAPEIVWNHRWEFDKQPLVFFTALEKLQNAGVDFSLHVMGQSFRKVPECFDQARVTLADRISTWGHQPSDSYNQILRQADIVVSTALHDFQGLSMLEAIYRGCVPVAPNRVAYPEYIPPDLLYSCVGDEADSLYRCLLGVMSGPLPKPPQVSQYLSSVLIARYRNEILNMTV